jgi:hypothetical protein
MKTINLYNFFFKFAKSLNGKSSLAAIGNLKNLPRLDDL